MGYQFPISVQLRDDEVTIHDCVIDMSIAQSVSEILMAIRDGVIQHEALDKYVPNLQKFCYSSQEFLELAEINKQIVEDMNYFKTCLGVFSGARVISTMDRFDNTFQYAIGSRTWLQAYQERLTLAASLFTQLQEKGYEFTTEEYATYSERYGSLIKEQEFAEKQKDLIDKQWMQDVRELGIEAADKRKVESLVVCGLMSQEDAEKTVKAGSALQRATGSYEQSKFADKVAAAANKATGVINKAEQEMFGDEPAKDDDVVLDTDYLVGLCEQVEDMYDTSKYKKAAYALHHLLQYVINRLSITGTGVTDIEPDTEENTLSNMFKTFTNVASTSLVRGMIDNECIEVCEDDDVSTAYNNLMTAMS